MAIVCIKIDGSIIDSKDLLQELGTSLKSLLERGHQPVIIHGGGKDIARNLKKLKKKFAFVKGHRVTDKKTLKTVQMVLSGDVNKRIVNALLCCGVPAVGISGIDGGLFEADKLLVDEKDIGFVGTITDVNTNVIEVLHTASMVPVISPISRSAKGVLYNVNTDLAASELAVALKADHLVFLLDVQGVLIGKKVRQEIRNAEIEDLISGEHIVKGMVPKVLSAKDAVYRGVYKIHICTWYGPDTILNELAVETSQGTVIY